MSLWTIIAQVFGLVPQAVDAGKQIAEAVKPAVHISPDDAELWHTVTYGPATVKYCTVCQQYVLRATDLCSEAVRRRNAL